MPLDAGGTVTGTVAVTSNRRLSHCQPASESGSDSESTTSLSPPLPSGPRGTVRRGGPARAATVALATDSEPQQQLTT
jgi:hypothetical protein